MGGQIKLAVGVNQTGHRWEVLDNLLNDVARVYPVDLVLELISLLWLKNVTSWFESLIEDCMGMQ